MRPLFDDAPLLLPARREVYEADAIAWLGARERLSDASVVTSLPDVSELPTLGFEGWRRWFEDAAALVASRVPDEGVAVFFQSDIKHGGAWIDKGAMVSRGAERAGMRLVFHTIVCRSPPGTSTFGRATYSHLLGYSWPSKPPGKPRAMAHVIPDAGFVPGRKAMGIHACLEACQFLLAETPHRTVVDPFCGWGTVLAVANALGLAAIGVDLSPRMCRRSRALTVDLP